MALPPPAMLAPSPAARLRGLSPVALLTLEVDVLERLDRLDALYGEALTLRRFCVGKS